MTQRRTTIGRRLGERIHVQFPNGDELTFTVMPDPDRRKRLVYAIEHDESVKVTRPDEPKPLPRVEAS